MPDEFKWWTREFEGSIGTREPDTGEHGQLSEWHMPSSRTSELDDNSVFGAAPTGGGPEPQHGG